MFCQKCGNQLNEGTRFCGTCGTPVEAAPVPPPEPVCASCGTKLEGGVKFCPKCGTPVGASGAQQAAPQTAPPPVYQQQPYQQTPAQPQYGAAPQYQQKWWEQYSPVPLNQVPETLRSTLSPQEVVLAISENSWACHIKFAIFCIFGLIIGLALIGGEMPEAGAFILAVLGVLFIHRVIIWRRRIIVFTDMRVLGAFNIKLFSTDKVDLPLPSLDSFSVDDTALGNLCGYTKIKFMSRRSTYYLPYITKESCQKIKDAYYGWAYGWASKPAR